MTVNGARACSVQGGICQLLICGVEYTNAAMFAWMFVEGMHLHNRLILAVFVAKPNYVVYYVVGWGAYTFTAEQLVEYEGRRSGSYIALRLFIVAYVKTDKPLNGV